MAANDDDDDDEANFPIHNTGFQMGSTTQHAVKSKPNSSSDMNSFAIGHINTNNNNNNNNNKIDATSASASALLPQYSLPSIEKAKEYFESVRPKRIRDYQQPNGYRLASPGEMRSSDGEPTVLYEWLCSSNREFGEFGIGISIYSYPPGPSRTLPDPPGPSRTLPDPPGPSRTLPDPPGPYRTLPDPTGPRDPMSRTGTLPDLPGPSRSHSPDGGSHSPDGGSHSPDGGSHRPDGGHTDLTDGGVTAA
jgi:hypothetical protein